MKKIIRITGFLFLILLCFSCKKEITYEGIKGDAKGKVRLLDPNSTEIITDYSGVAIVVDGASPEMNTVSDKDGKYTLPGLRTGVYDLVFKKEGYATFKIMSWLFAGGNVPAYISSVILYKIPESKVSDLKVDTSYFGVNAEAKVTNRNQLNYRYFISDKPDVSCDKYLVTNSMYLYADDPSLQVSINVSVINIFPKGKKLYVKVYPCASSSGYMNSETGLMSYPVNPDQGSNTAEFTIPYDTYYY